MRKTILIILIGIGLGYLAALINWIMAEHYPWPEEPRVSFGVFVPGWDEDTQTLTY